ncbi:MAG TPA: 2Fe-2S iron-sulfur cluster-binding protein, partial [Acidimicrobiales bacterium]
MLVSFVLNGDRTEVECEPGTTLLTVLRRLGCWSVRYGSPTGETGAAAVLIDGRLVSSDVMLAAQAGDHEVTTVEALDVAIDHLDPIQAAFVETGALQSGYSAGAMVLAAKALLDRDPDPSDEAIRDVLSGVLDRETGYVKVVEAVRRAAARGRGEPVPAFEPVFLAPLTGGCLDGGTVASDDRPPAFPRIVPSRDVPATSVVGTAAPKVDAVRLVKGKPAFTDDIEPRGMLHAKVLRSPHAHARVVAVDDRAAWAVRGVRAVLHHGNTPRVKYASGGQSWPNPHPWDQVCFDDEVRHVGDRVAAVAAETLEAAEEACRRLEVTYEVLPAVFDELAAVAPGAPRVHTEDDSIGVEDISSNISCRIRGQTVKDMDAALSGSVRVVESTYRVHQVQHCSIEPHVAIAW